MQIPPNVFAEKTESLLARLRERLKAAITDALDDSENAEGTSLRIDVQLTRANEPETSNSRVESLHTEEIQLSSLLDALPDSLEASLVSNSLKPSNSLVNASEQNDVALTNGVCDFQESRPGSPSDSTDSSSSLNEENQDTGSLIIGHAVRRKAAAGLRSNRGSDGIEKRRRKATGGLRLPPSGLASPQDNDRSIRQLKSDSRFFSKRKASADDGQAQLRPSSLDRLLQGIWERIHAGPGFDVAQLGQGEIQHITLNNELDSVIQQAHDVNFRRMNFLCRDVSKASQACRAVELIVQAHWIDSFNARVERLAERQEVRNMKVAIVEASQDFGWTEQQLRNKMAIWNGYHQIKEAGGWAALVFSGMGIYRFCKYRVAFDHDSMQKLRAMRTRFEVAADTLHPCWRNLLTIVGESSTPRFFGHPLDWVISDATTHRGPPNSLVALPLAQTYIQQDTDFSFQHIDSCVVDANVWHNIDPRQSWTAMRYGGFNCMSCHKTQSNDPRASECQCFPELFDGKTMPSPVQVFQTNNGKNNGLLACVPFKRGSAIGEFAGLVTAGLKDLDVMEGEVEGRQYQIWQGRQGNHIKFVNHSCHPNSQFQKFFWLGVERIILVSKGVEADEEITVDYSDSYWKHLDKACLCGSSVCRYQHRAE